MSKYRSSFFDAIREGAKRSAERVAPLVVEQLQPRSVLDVGCGQGIWLEAFQNQGVSEVVGMDGAYVSLADLAISPDDFVPANLEQEFDLARQFDLVLSLEVAEHLDVECAERFVQSLVRHSSCILFSAAIPHQGGTSHVNEQWPSYWAGIFAKHGFEPWDLLRPSFWDDDEVEYWYSQNMILFVKEGDESRYPFLQRASDPRQAAQLNLVHPRQYMNAVAAKETAEVKLWSCRAELVRIDMEKYVPAGGTIILADSGTLPLDKSTHREITRLMETNGTYQGPPPDVQSAVLEIENLRRLGANFLVQTWQAFWWEAKYPGFDSYLQQEAKCALNNDRCRIYEFRQS